MVAKTNLVTKLWLSKIHGVGVLIIKDDWLKLLLLSTNLRLKLVVKLISSI